MNAPFFPLPVSLSRRASQAIAGALLVLLGGFSFVSSQAAPPLSQPQLCNTPSSTNFSLASRVVGDSKVPSLSKEGRGRVNLDFIPVEERTSRTRRGYPSVAAPEGAYGVEGHGTPSSVFYRTGEPMDAKELAMWISTDSRYCAGMTVYLMCCETGKGGRSFAQKLADILGTEVVAPTEKLWPLQNGDYIVAQERMRKTFPGFKTGEQRADTTRPGAMKTFKPSSRASMVASSSRDGSSQSLSSSSAASALVAVQKTPKKPLLRASARTAALLAGIQGQRDSTLFLNSKER